MKAHSQGLPKVCAAECPEGFSTKGKGGLSKGFPSGGMVSWMEGKGSLFESRVRGTEAWFQAMFRTGFGRSGEGATGPDSGTWKGARNGAFCKGWESFLERVFSERKEGCRFVLHRVRRRGEEGNVRMECREVLFSLPSDGKGHSPEFSPRSEGVWNIGRESSSTCFQRGLGFGFRIRVRAKKSRPLGEGP